jgi:hypothetical protein
MVYNSNRIRYIGGVVEMLGGARLLGASKECGMDDAGSSRSMP